MQLPRRVRTPKQVENQVAYIQTLMKESHDFETSVTGAGIQESDGVASFRELMLEKCSFYYDLKDVFVSRAGFSPTCTSGGLSVHGFASNDCEYFSASDENEYEESDESEGDEDEEAPQSLSSNSDDSSKEDNDDSPDAVTEADANGTKIDTNISENDTNGSNNESVTTPPNYSSASQSIYAKNPTKQSRKSPEQCQTPNNTRKRPANTSLRSKVLNKKGKKRNKVSTIGFGGNSPLDAVLTKLLKHKLHNCAQQKVQDNDPAVIIEKLARNFKSTADSLGSRVMAAKACELFRQFLRAEELIELDEMLDTSA